MSNLIKLSPQQKRFIHEMDDWLEGDYYHDGLQARSNMDMFKKIYKKMCARNGIYQHNTIYWQLQHILKSNAYNDSERFLMNTLREFYIENK